MNKKKEDVIRLVLEVTLLTMMYFLLFIDSSHPWGVFAICIYSFNVSYTVTLRIFESFWLYRVNDRIIRFLEPRLHHSILEKLKVIKGLEYVGRLHFGFCLKSVTSGICYFDHKNKLNWLGLKKTHILKALLFLFACFLFVSSFLYLPFSDLYHHKSVLLSLYFLFISSFFFVMHYIMNRGFYYLHYASFDFGIKKQREFIKHLNGYDDGFASYEFKKENMEIQHSYFDMNYDGVKRNYFRYKDFLKTIKVFYDIKPDEDRYKKTAHCMLWFLFSDLRHDRRSIIHFMILFLLLIFALASSSLLFLIVMHALLLFAVKKYHWSSKNIGNLYDAVIKVLAYTFFSDFRSKKSKFRFWVKMSLLLKFRRWSYSFKQLIHLPKSNSQACGAVVQRTKTSDYDSLIVFQYMHEVPVYATPSELHCFIKWFAINDDDYDHVNATYIKNLAYLYPEITPKLIDRLLLERLPYTRISTICYIITKDLRGYVDTICNLFSGGDYWKVERYYCIALAYFGGDRLEAFLKRELDRYWFDPGVYHFKVSAIQALYCVCMKNKSISYQPYWARYQDLIPVLYSDDCFIPSALDEFYNLIQKIEETKQKVLSLLAPNAT